MKKTVFITGLMGVAALLSACHQSPLDTASPKIAAKFLIDASKFAEKKENRMVSGRGYKECMEENKQHFNCAALFKFMTDYAKSNVEFKGLTVADLKNKKTFNKVRESYETALFLSF